MTFAAGDATLRRMGNKELRTSSPGTLSAPDGSVCPGCVSEGPVGDVVAPTGSAARCAVEARDERSGGSPQVIVCNLTGSNEVMVDLPSPLVQLASRQPLFHSPLVAFSKRI